MRWILGAVSSAFFWDAIGRGLIEEGEGTPVTVAFEWWDAIGRWVDNPAFEIAGLLLGGWLIYSAIAKTIKDETVKVEALTNARDSERKQLRQDVISETSKLISENNSLVQGAIGLFILSERTQKLETVVDNYDSRNRDLNMQLENARAKGCLGVFAKKTQSTMMQVAKNTMASIGVESQDWEHLIELSESDLERVKIPETFTESADIKNYQRTMALNEKRKTCFKYHLTRLNEKRVEAIEKTRADAMKLADGG